MRWTLTDVSFQFPTADGRIVDALNGVSLTITQGERLALIGANGSGKSTLARLLAGLLPPSSGHMLITWDTNDTSPAMTEEQSLAALVFQGPDDNLIAETVAQEIALALEHAGQSRIDDGQAVELLAAYGLDHLRDRPTQQLSGGEKQKLAIACAFASGRDLIVLDEPTSHLDPPGRRELLEYLLSDTSELPNRPALVLITQYIEDTRRFPRVVVLESGQVVFDGPPDQWTGMTRAASPNLPQPLTNAEHPVIVRTENLSQLAQDRWPLPNNPLTDISVEIRAGDAIGLCGPIGCGKSTLAYHLAGLFDSYGGTIERSWDGARGFPPALMIQFPERQLFCPTVGEDVAFGPRARGSDIARAKELASAALDALGLPFAHFARRSPFDLSAGQQRRVGMAGVTACPAPLYILDEPTAALDADGLERLQRVLADWRKSGIAYLVISHDLDWLEHVTHRVWVMNSGRVIFDGDWTDSSHLAPILQPIGFANDSAALGVRPS
ncbi:MAG: ABC transporter ATP-binding protein [candidate division Zixibacteria bacterium]|nr:ABC transporter ATP-binding protein [candidate division Zixibacteria bacterium]